MPEQSEPTRIHFSPNPPLVISDELLIEARRSVHGMSPDDIAFAKSNTVVIDNTTNRLLIDAVDPLPPFDAAPVIELQPALLRIVRPIGGLAIDGFLIDMRRVKKPPIVNRTEGLENSEQWEALKTMNPLGAIFLNRLEATYIGELGLEETAKYFAASVDIYLEALQQGKDPQTCYDLCMAHFSSSTQL